jgi:mitochondrial fission protein ELM1
MNETATQTAPESWILSQAYPGLISQALGLAEAAGLSPRQVVLAPRAPWRWVTARLWPAPLAALHLPAEVPPLLLCCGGMGAVAGAALKRRHPGVKLVQIQDPRMDPKLFDVVVVNTHDGMTGPNVVVTRTALHRVTQARLAAERDAWRERLAPLPRPLVAVLVGGSNGRYRLGAAEAEVLAGQLAEMMRRDGVGVALTPSRRTDPAARAVFARVLRPLGAYVWDMTGENPYFGLLANADMIVATEDSVSMVSEGCATSAPVMLAALPGKSRRIGQFTAGLVAAGRVKPFAGRYESWAVQPLDDTALAGAEIRRRLNF